MPGRDEPVRLSGVVTQVRARHEGARFDSDVFLIADGVLPARGDRGRGGASPPASSPRSSCRPGPAPRSGARPAHERDVSAVLRPDEVAAADRARPRRLPLVRQPRLPRRHPRRARQHLRHLRRRDEDDVRDLPALRPVPLGRARRRRDEHEGAHLQREGRGPALPRPRERASSRPSSRRSTATSG